MNPINFSLKLFYVRHMPIWLANICFYISFIIGWWLFCLLIYLVLWALRP